MRGSHIPDQHSTLSDRQQRIDKLVRDLQSQTDVPLWVFAHVEAIRAAALGEPLVHGLRGRLVRSVFKAAGRSSVSLFALWLFGFVAILRCWAQALFVAKLPVEGVFVGFGAGSEKPLFERFRAETSGTAICVNQNDPRSLGSVSRPSLANLLGRLYAECQRVYLGMRRAKLPVPSDGFCMWMTLSAIRIGAYTFTRVWAEQLPQSVRRVVFIVPDVQCFATLDGRQPNQRYTIEYWQHGLIFRSLLIPPADRILALNCLEREHMRGLSASPLELIYRDIPSAVVSRTATMLFASIYSFPGFDRTSQIPTLQALFACAGTNGLTVVIRPHPAEDGSFWPRHFPGLQVDSSATSFSDCVKRWRPSLVASWFSTSLLDALWLGVAPVLLTAGSRRYVNDMVFPLDRIALNWPEDRVTIETMIHKDADYWCWVTQRRDQVFGPALEVGDSTPSISHPADGEMR